MFVLKSLTEVLSLLPAINSKPEESRPVVFWHGMGDTYNSSAMQSVFSTVHSVRPQLSIHSVYLDVDESEDQKASLFGNLNDQIALVCDEINSIPELHDKEFDFIGFSQGGLFARAAIERCGLKVNNLITFGSPHSGVADLPRCGDSDWFCKRRNALLKRQVWKQNIQHSVIAAQYFRDPMDYESYLKNSIFLPDINNERDFNSTLVENLGSIEQLVLIQFGKDEKVVPKESAWFYDLDKLTGETIKFEDTDYYKKDLLGLKSLYDENRIEFLEIDDVHMAIGDEFLKQITEKYLS